MTETSILLYHRPELVELALRYAPWCQLVATAAAPEVCQPALFLDHQGMWLCMPGYAQPYQPSDGEIQRRARSRVPTDLVRACGVQLENRRVLDACAGFGSDGLLLAQRGAQVSLVEKQRLIWIMLDERARQIANAQTICADASQVLTDQDRQAEAWDVVLLDPMFPPTSKRALPNRGLQHLRELTESVEIEQDEILPLLLQSRQCCKGRVVLKRRLKDSVLAQPDFQIKAKSVRFDIYVGLA